MMVLHIICKRIMPLYLNDDPYGQLEKLCKK